MTTTRTTVWVSGQVLTAAALNNEFNNLMNAPAIVNSDISASAAIAYSKLNLAGLIANADISAVAAIVFSKLDSTTVAGVTATQTLTNKRITKRVLSLSAGSATPAIDTDNYDVVHITAQSAAITSFTTNLTGTPVDGDTLRISITDDGTARGITWGTSFESSGNVTLPTTTVISTRLDVGLLWNTETSKWRCVAVA